MLGEARLKQLNELAGALNKEELIWTQGYLAGVLSVKNVNATGPLPISSSALPVNGFKKLSIVYGTETGNAKNLASKFAQQAKQSGAAVKLSALDQYRLTDLPKEENLIVVISTHGEGEPPASARKFYDHVHDQSFKLTRTNF